MLYGEIHEGTSYIYDVTLSIDIHDMCSVNLSFPQAGFHFGYVGTVILHLSYKPSTPFPCLCFLGYWDTPTGEPEVTAEGEPHGTHHGDYGTAEPEGEPEATAHPEGETTPHAEGEPETTPHAEGEPETTPHAEGEPETTPHAEGEPETTPHAEGEPETTPHAEGEPETTPHAEGEPETTPHAEGEPETTPHAEGEPETTPHAEGEPETTPHAEGAPETTPHAESAPETTPAVETLPPAGKRAGTYLVHMQSCLSLQHDLFSMSKMVLIMMMCTQVYLADLESHACRNVGVGGM